MIFIHSSFRTSSTFLWSRVRTNSNATTYYEIFNDALGDISVELIRNTTDSSWPSKHPKGAPYYLEYLPLLDEHGKLRGFDPSMSMERFIPPEGPSGAISDAEANYVRGLIDYAEARGKIPVLTAVRSMGRLPGLKAAAPGTHLLLYRNLFQQWCSYTELDRLGHAFAIAHAPAVIRLSQHDRSIAQIASLVPVEHHSPKDVNTFYQFVLLHLYCYAHAAAAADLIFDINRAAKDSSYRQEIESMFFQQGLRVDLSGAKQSIAYSQLEFPSATELRDFLTVAGNVVIGSAPSEVGRRFAEKALSDLFEEHDRHNFHAKAIRSALGHAIDERETARTEAVRAGDQRDSLTAERDVARAELEEAIRACAVARAAHADALSHAEAMQVACEAARAEVEAIRNERNTALSEHDNSVLARLSAEAERAAALAERDALRSEADAQRLGREAAEAEREASRAEAEAQRIAREAAEAERHAEAQARQVVEAERDGHRSEAEAQRLAREAAEVEREASRAEAEAHRRARETAEAERHAEAQARRVAEAERASALGERDISRSEADAHRRARETAEADCDAALADLTKIRTDSDLLRDSVETATADREAALAAQKAAEARHAALLRWSVAFHDSTAASLSWKLTRPLRWLRIGRPKRPGGPPS